MLVIGGTYIERCFEPYWLALYGSGLRAAAVLSSLGESCEFESCIGNEERDQLSLLCNSFGVKLGKVHEIANTVRFTYQHPLATPSMTPERPEIKQTQRINASDEMVLRFGMLEADVVTASSVAVYDPQSAYNPQPFQANGSSCKKLAVLTNMWEGQLLTKKSDPLEIGHEILKTQHAEVVVVKQGPFGCLVITPKATDQIPAFTTNKVFSIGSGDVFAAGFAHYWARQLLSPAEAAEKASRCTAFYCATQQTSLRSNEQVISSLSPAILDRKKLETALVYLAAPFFTMAQRWLVEEAYSALRGMRMNVFSPFHDVGIGVAEDVVPADINALEKSTVVLAMLDGMDPGTIFEIGYAVKLGIPVIGFSQNGSDEEVKMLLGTGCILVDDFATAIYRTVWAALQA